MLTVLDSPETEVKGGEEGDLVFYFRPEKAGNYEIKVHATMGGKTTNKVTLSLVVPSAVGASLGSTNLNPVYLVVGGCLIAIILGFFLFKTKKARRIA